MTTFEKLQTVKLGNGNIQNLRNSLLKTGFCRPIVVSGSGRFINTSDFYRRVMNVLNEIGIEFEVGNDAPRGGKCGTFVQITDKKFLAKMNKTNKAGIKAKKQAVIEKEKLAKEIQLKRELAKKELESLIEGNENNIEYVLTTWKNTGFLHPAPKLVCIAKEISGRGWRSFEQSI